jgi:hypothetical protein
MCIVVAGDRFWRCDELVTAIVRRLMARYGSDIVIVQSGGNRVDHAKATGDTEERDAVLAG